MSKKQKTAPIEVPDEGSESGGPTPFDEIQAKLNKTEVKPEDRHDFLERIADFCLFSLSSKGKWRRFNWNFKPNFGGKRRQS